MRNRDISKNLQLLVVKNLEYKNQMEKFGDKSGEVVLSSINEQLKNDVKEEYFLKVLLESKLFRLNFSKNSLKKLALFVKEKLVSPGELIYKENINDRNIYFLISGQIEFYFENKNNKKPHIIATIKQQNSLIFNQLGFFCDNYTQSNARAVKTATRLCYVSQREFQEVLKDFPQDLESFCKVRDNLSIYSRLNDIQCYSCNNNGHLQSECPKYFPIKFRSIQIIQKNNLSQPNHRKLQTRVRTFKQNSLNCFTTFRTRLIKYRYDISQIIAQNGINEQKLSLNDKKFTKQMIKFAYDINNEQYIELPSSEGEGYYVEDEFDDDDDDIENEEFGKSELSKLEPSDSNELDIKSSFRRCDEDSRLQAEYSKEIIPRNNKSQNYIDANSEFKTDYQQQSQHSYLVGDKKPGTFNDTEFDSGLYQNTPTQYKRELESRKGSGFTVKTRTHKQQTQQQESNDKKRFSNLIYEEKNKVEEEDDEDSQKFFSSLQQSQIHRSNSVSSSKKNIQSSSYQQQMKNASKSELNNIQNERGGIESQYYNTKSIISLSKQQSTASNHKDVSRSSKLGIQRLISQSMSQNIKSSSKNLAGKQCTLDYLNSIHHSINTYTEYGDKTFVSQSSIDPVQYKASQNFSTQLIRGRSQTGGPGSSYKEVNRSQTRNSNFAYSQQGFQKSSMARIGNQHEDQNANQNQKYKNDGSSPSKFIKDIRNQGYPFYEEGFTSIKEYEVYFPINNQKTVMKQLKLYLLKTQIKKRKEQTAVKKKRGKQKKKKVDTTKSSQFNKQKQ